MISSEYLHKRLSRKIQINPAQSKAIADYVNAANRNTAITVGRASRLLCLDDVKMKIALSSLVDMGILHRESTIRCPKCGLLVERVGNIAGMKKKIHCYGCESDVEVDESDIEEVYTLRVINIVDAPDVSLAPDEKPGDLLLHFFKELGWNGRDYLDPSKIRTTQEVFDSLYDTMYERCPDAVAIGMGLMNSGPGTEDFIPPGKVYLMKGWTEPCPKEGDESHAA